MQVYGDSAGHPIAVAGGTGPATPPNGTVVQLGFDEATNSGLTRLVGEQTEWPNIVITASTITWNGSQIRINPDGTDATAAKQVKALITKLFDDAQNLTAADQRNLFRLYAKRLGLA